MTNEPSRDKCNIGGDYCRWTVAYHISIADLELAVNFPLPKYQISSREVPDSASVTARCDFARPGHTARGEVTARVAREASARRAMSAHRRFCQSKSSMPLARVAAVRHHIHDQNGIRTRQEWVEPTGAGYNEHRDQQTARLLAATRLTVQREIEGLPFVVTSACLEVGIHGSHCCVHSPSKENCWQPCGPISEPPDSPYADLS